MESQGGFTLPSGVYLTAKEEDKIDVELAEQLLLELLRYFKVLWSHDFVKAAHAYTAECLIQKLEQPKKVSEIAPEDLPQLSPESRALLGED